MTWHIHKWSAWKDYHQPMQDNRSGRRWNEDWQKRRCSRCGKRQTRPT